MPKRRYINARALLERIWLKPLRWWLLGLFWLNGGVQVAATHDGWWDVPFALLCTALAIEFFRRGHDEWKQSREVCGPKVERIP